MLAAWHFPKVHDKLTQLLEAQRPIELLVRHRGKGFPKTQSLKKKSPGKRDRFRESVLKSLEFCIIY